MKNKKMLLFLLLTAMLILSGCSMATVDQMYSPPKRSDAYKNLQSVIDQAMAGMSYCAPSAGEHQQTVQIVDLDGDGKEEYLLYAKGNTNQPLKILIFQEKEGIYVHTDTIEHNGIAFEQVEYAQMDDRPGMEIVVGSQISDQLLRTVSVYTFLNGQAELLVSANYTKFLTVDLDADGFSELFLIRPGQHGMDNGIAELYGVENGIVERSNEVNMSRPVDNLKRIIVGKMHDADAAVYIASSVDETALITDVFAYVNGMFTNVSFSNESGTSVGTLRNYYVYADDIDNDGVVELPSIVKMKSIGQLVAVKRQNMIRWYAMASDGSEVVKSYTFHNFIHGWYVELDKQWATRTAVLQQGNNYEFYIWDEEFQHVRKVMTIYALSGQNREEQSREENQLVLMKNDTVIYTAKLEKAAAGFGITQDYALLSFHPIQQDWKTGEI